MPTALLDPTGPILTARRFPTGLLIMGIVLWAIVLGMIALSVAFPTQANGVLALDMIGL